MVGCRRHATFLRVIFVLLPLLAASRAEATRSARFVATRDTTIASDPVTPPDPSYTVRSNGQGAAMYVGQTGTAGVRRALIAFSLNSASGCTDLTANGVNDCPIPTGSTVTSVSVTISLTRAPAAAVSQSFTLSRITQSWGEGASLSVDPNGGGLVQALANDATWLRRFYNVTSWSTPGGNFNAASASRAIDPLTLGAYTFISNASLVADAQTWVNSSANNHGWMLRGLEGGAQTALQFASAENPDANQRPLLTVNYRAPQGSACAIASDCVAGLFCTNGVCCNVSACSASDQCHNAGTCTAPSGTCTNPAKTNGSPCSFDSSLCTSDQCQGGICSGIADQGGVVCRGAMGVCDVQEICTNGIASCPADSKRPPGFACPTDNNFCTVDQCNGVSNACPYSAAPVGTSCRPQNGVCDVAETCNGTTTCPVDGFALSSVECRAPSCQDSAVAVLPANCTGFGPSCPALTTQACAPFTCAGNFCQGGCTIDSQCAAGNYCAPPNCLEQKKQGDACTANNQCSSNICVDGVCCNTTCGGGNVNDCQACNLTGTVGTCTPRPASTTCRASAGGCDLVETCDGRAVTCPSDSFQLASFVCRAASCSNGVGTLAENCPGGGPACPSLETVTCSPFACDATACRTSCTLDTHCTVNFYCSSGGCLPKKAVGLSCTAGNQCTSGSCADGVCCNAACTGQCEACDVTPGTCTAVTGAPRGSRPACASDGSACSGSCNGTLRTSCFLPGASTQCTFASCTSGVATLQAFCNGTGSCPANQTQNCSPFSCGPTACFATCSIDVQCAAGFYCAGGVCAPKLTGGTACVSSNQCTSGFCVDGVCCDAACSGQCEACDVPDSVGACTAVTGDPRGGRPACLTDNASNCGGTCDGALRSSCTYPGVGVVCRQASCASDVAVLPTFCNGAGSCPAEIRQECNPFACNSAGTACAGDCTLDSHCSASESCSAGVCVPKGAIGNACAEGNDCVSGVCVDGYCCDSPCTGQCEACDVAGLEGSCRAVSGAPHGARTACTAAGSGCDGFCDGARRDGCAYPGAEMQCRPGSCAGGVATLASFCIGSGACPPIQEQICPGSCSGTICGGGQSCTSNTQCSATQFCSAGVCIAKLANGQPCGASSHCNSGQCVDGYCCNLPCTEQCFACNLPSQEGFCTPVAGPTLGGRPACSGAGPCGGQCDGTVAATCVSPGAETLCGVGSCINGVASGQASCNGAGSCLPPTTTACLAYVCDEAACFTSCSSNDACAAGFLCEGTQCVEAPEPDGGAGTAGGGAGGSGGSATGGSGASVASGGSGATGAVDGGVDGGAGKKGSPPEDDGGCGCRVPARSRSGLSALPWLAALLIFARRRRERRAHAASASNG
jgi:hypothetical protein